MSSPSHSNATDLWPPEEEDDSEYIYELEEPDQDDDGEGDGDDIWGDDQNGGGDDDDDDDDDEDDSGESDGDGGGGQPIAVGELTPREILMLLTVNNLGSHLLAARIERGGRILRSGLRRDREEAQFPEVPSKAGRELMASGTFGSNDLAVSSQAPAAGRSMTLPRRLLDRELGIGDVFSRKLNRNLMMQGMIPSSKPDMVVRFPEPVYSGQFSDDGNFFYAVGKDFKVRMYDTSNPYKWRYYKTAHFPYGNWTLTDASLSPDNRWLAISSLLPDVCLAPTDPNDKGDPYVLDLSESGGTGRDQGGPFESPRSRGGRFGHFGIFSLRYSGDGRELVAGVSRGGVVVYDIESRRVLHRIEGHDKDVNAVCFADASSPHILYSGSDDATIKVWDRRSMADGREAGAFVGHVNGLTYLDSKGDGRYILSNGKDHSMKLWDLRMAMGSAEFAADDPRRYTRDRILDYRYRDFDAEDFFQHPRDNSVVTFRGHKISTTLIRCHFSPPGSTNSRYVYSGSADGKVYVWNLDATLAAKIEVSRTAAVAMNTDGFGRHTIVREAHWHPNAPLLVSSSMRGYGFGFCSVHSYNESKDDEEDPQRGRVVDSMLRPWVFDTDDDPDADEHWW